VHTSNDVKFLSHNIEIAGCSRDVLETFIICSCSIMLSTIIAFVIRLSNNKSNNSRVWYTYKKMYTRALFLQKTHNSRERSLSIFRKGNDLCIVITQASVSLRVLNRGLLPCALSRYDAIRCAKRRAGVPSWPRYDCLAIAEKSHLTLSAYVKSA